MSLDKNIKEFGRVKYEFFKSIGHVELPLRIFPTHEKSVVEVKQENGLYVITEWRRIGE